MYWWLNDSSLKNISCDGLCIASTVVLRPGIMRAGTHWGLCVALFRNQAKRPCGPVIPCAFCPVPSRVPLVSVSCVLPFLFSRPLLLSSLCFSCTDIPKSCQLLGMFTEGRLRKATFWNSSLKAWNFLQSTSPFYVKPKHDIIFHGQKGTLKEPVS